MAPSASVDTTSALSSDTNSDLDQNVANRNSNESLASKSDMGSFSRQRLKGRMETDSTGVMSKMMNDLNSLPKIEGSGIQERASNRMEQIMTYDEESSSEHINAFEEKHLFGTEVKQKQYSKQLPYMEKPPEGAKWLGIDGYWYDVATFIAKHPGGPVIEEFLGYDATDAFRGFHKTDVLKQRHFRPVGYYKRSWKDFSKAMHKLHEDLIEEGFYKVNYYWYAMKFSVTFALIASVFVLMAHCADSYLMLTVIAALLALFFQQNGFLMHDLMHTQFTHNRFIDESLGVYCGTACIGISASWWKDEHMYHHALTCMVDIANNYYDPQMKEEIWAQSVKLFPFFQTRLDYIMIKLQHITFLPVCMLIGRLAVTIDSFHLEKRWYEWVAIIIHFSWIAFLLSYIPTWTQLVYFYCLASTLQGILHVQLLANHYSKEFNYREEIIPDWYSKQVLTNINITNPRWLDFFWGGLNYHIEHHCFPRMPRNRLREISFRIKEVCKQHDVFYDECATFEVIWRTLKHLKQVGDLFALKDPR